jgi:hypothetical protein
MRTDSARIFFNRDPIRLTCHATATNESFHRLKSPLINLLPRIPLARMCGFDEWLSFSASCFFDTPRAAAALVIAPGCRTAFLIQFFPMTLLSRQSPRQALHIVTEGDELLSGVSHVSFSSCGAGFSPKLRRSRGAADETYSAAHDSLCAAFPARVRRWPSRAADRWRERAPS